MFQFSIFSFYTEDNDWECCPVVECLPNTPEILDLILNLHNINNVKKLSSD